VGEGLGCGGRDGRAKSRVKAVMCHVDAIEFAGASNVRIEGAEICFERSHEEVGLVVWRGVIRSWMLTIDDMRMLVAYPSKPQFTTESAGRPPCANPVQSVRQFARKVMSRKVELG
jgi:hypothetical protein